jgi:hypothetical protein
VLERKKIKSELLRVSAAKAEMDYLIEQKLDEIKRLKDAMAKQEEAEALLITKLDALGE